MAERCQLCGRLLGGDHLRAHRLTVELDEGARRVDLLLCLRDRDLLWDSFEQSYDAALVDHEAAAAGLRREAERPAPKPAAV